MAPQKTGRRPQSVFGRGPGSAARGDSYGRPANPVAAKGAPGSRTAALAR